MRIVAESALDASAGLKVEMPVVRHPIGVEAGAHLVYLDEDDARNAGALQAHGMSLAERILKKESLQSRTEDVFLVPNRWL